LNAVSLTQATNVNGTKKDKQTFQDLSRERELNTNLIKRKET